MTKRHIQADWFKLDSDTRIALFGNLIEYTEQYEFDAVPEELTAIEKEVGGSFGIENDKLYWSEMWIGGAGTPEYDYSDCQDETYGAALGMLERIEKLGYGHVEDIQSDHDSAFVYLVKWELEGKNAEYKNTMDR